MCNAQGTDSVCLYSTNYCVNVFLRIVFPLLTRLHLQDHLRLTFISFCVASGHLHSAVLPAAAAIAHCTVHVSFPDTL